MRIGLQYPQHVVKGDLMGRFLGITVKRVAPCRYLDGDLKEPYEMSMALGAKLQTSNFLFSPPAHLCAVTYITEISLHVTLSNQSHSLSQTFFFLTVSNFVIQLFVFDTVSTRQRPTFYNSCTKETTSTLCTPNFHMKSDYLIYPSHISYRQFKGLFYCVGVSEDCKGTRIFMIQICPTYNNERCSRRILDEINMYFQYIILSENMMLLLDDDNFYEKIKK